MNRRKLAFGLILISLMLGGCGGAATVIRYYVVDPVASSSIANLDQQSVQILDLKLPQYLERFQIARREGSNQLVFSSNQQWGESLRKNLYRTMTRNLSVLLNSADVGSAISRSFSTPDYSLRVSIEAFEQGADGRVRLAARYQLIAGSDISTHHFDQVAERDSGDSYANMISDMQDLFGELCTAIASRIVASEQSVDA